MEPGRKRGKEGVSKRTERAKGVGGTECSGERRGGGEGQRESDHEEEAEEEGGVRKEEGGRDQLLPDGFPTKQVRLHINCT